MMKHFTSFLLVAIFAICLEFSQGQQSGYNYAKKTMGERDGDLTPSAIAGVALGCVGFLGALIVTGFFCFYVYRQQRQHDSLNNSFAPTARI